MKSNGTLLNYCSFKEKLSLRILLSPEFCYGSLKHYQGFYYSHFTDKETELSILQVNGECSKFTLFLRLLIKLQEMQRACLWDILPLELLSLMNSVCESYTEQELHRGPWFFLNNAENTRALYTSLSLLSPPQYLCEVWAVFFFFFFSPAAGAFPCTLTLQMVTVTGQESHTQSLVTENLNTPEGLSTV